MGLEFLCFKHVGNLAGGTPRNKLGLPEIQKKERRLSDNFQMTTLLSNQKP